MLPRHFLSFDFSTSHHPTFPLLAPTARFYFYSKTADKGWRRDNLEAMRVKMDGIVFHMFFISLALLLLFPSTPLSSRNFHVFSVTTNAVCTLKSPRKTNAFQSKSDIFSRQFHVTERGTGPCLVDDVRSFQVHVRLVYLDLDRCLQMREWAPSL